MRLFGRDRLGDVPVFDDLAGIIKAEDIHYRTFAFCRKGPDMGNHQIALGDSTDDFGMDRRCDGARGGLIRGEAHMLT